MAALASLWDLNFGAYLGVSAAGCACVLLQVHLGVALARAFALAGGPGSPRVESSLRAASSASASAPLLAAYALIQARGSPWDYLSSVGLALATVAVLLGTKFAGLGPLLQGARGEQRLKGSAAEDDALGAGGRAQRRLAGAARAAAGLQALGSALLVFGAAPGGGQLLCASALLRLGLALDAAGAGARALALEPGDDGAGDSSSARAGAARAVGLAPLVGGLALLDHAVWGPCQLPVLPLHPLLYCALFSAFVVALVFAVRASLGGGVEAGAPFAEFDFHFLLDEELEMSVGPHIESLRSKLAKVLYTALFLAAGRALAGTFHVDASGKGLTVAWGEPCSAAACALAALLAGVYTVEFLGSGAAAGGEGGEGAAQAESAPGDAPDAASGVVATNGVEAGGDLGTAARALKAAILGGPTPGLMLALLAGGSGQVLGLGSLAAVLAVWLQVAALLLFLLWHGDSAKLPEPPLDGTCTLCWEPKGDHAAKAAAGLQQVTHLLLRGGLLLGWLNLGAITWLVAGPFLLIFIFLLLPPEARADFGMILVTPAGIAKAHMLTFLDQRRAAAQEAVALAAVSKAAALLEAEGDQAGPSGGKGSNKEKSAKAPGKAQSGAKSEKKGGGAKKKHV